jgi:hypothetical protein
MVVDYFPYFLTIGNQPPSDFLEHMNLIMLIQTRGVTCMFGGEWKSLAVQGCFTMLL